MEKMNEAVGMKNCFTIDGGGKRLVRPFKRQELWKCISCVASEVTYRKKGHKLCSEIQKYFVGCHLLNHEEMFVERPIYIRYVVITIVIFTSMPAIESFYLT